MKQLNKNLLKNQVDRQIDKESTKIQKKTTMTITKLGIQLTSKMCAHVSNVKLKLS